MGIPYLLCHSVMQQIWRKAHDTSGGRRKLYEYLDHFFSAHIEGHQLGSKAEHMYLSNGIISFARRNESTARLITNVAHEICLIDNNLTEDLHVSAQELGLGDLRICSVICDLSNVSPKKVALFVVASTREIGWNQGTRNRKHQQ